MIKFAAVVIVLVATSAIAAAEPYPHVDGSARRAAWAAGDFDGDLVVDFVRVETPAGSAAGAVAVFFSARGLARAPLLGPVSPMGPRLTARDLDHDRDLDLVLSIPSGEIVGVWLNDGAGAFRPAGPQLPAEFGRGPPDVVPDGIGTVVAGATHRLLPHAVRVAPHGLVLQGQAGPHQPPVTTAATAQHGLARGRAPPFRSL